MKWEKPSPSRRHPVKKMPRAYAGLARCTQGANERAQLPIGSDWTDRPKSITAARIKVAVHATWPHPAADHERTYTSSDVSEYRTSGAFHQVRPSKPVLGTLAARCSNALFASYRWNRFNQALGVF